MINILSYVKINQGDTMNEVSKTLYIPLYCKAYVSKRKLFLSDKKAEEIWNSVGFKLKGKSKSKWLAYYMGIRCAVFDNWLTEKLTAGNYACVIHLGCGLDSRITRTKAKTPKWYDVDFAEVISERKQYFQETENYKMLSYDIRDRSWLTEISETKSAVVIMEGISMYLTAEELNELFDNLSKKFNSIALLTDCYTVKAARLSKYKNPINDVGVTKVYGIDNPERLDTDELKFCYEHEMTPDKYINKLKGFEKTVFKKLYCGGFAKKLYRLYEFKK